MAVSGLSSISARIKSSCNLTGKCFEMPNVSYTQTLYETCFEDTLRKKYRFQKKRSITQQQMNEKNEIKLSEFENNNYIFNLKNKRWQKILK